MAESKFRWESVGEVSEKRRESVGKREENGCFDRGSMMLRRVEAKKEGF